MQHSITWPGSLAIWGPLTVEGGSTAPRLGTHAGMARAVWSGTVSFGLVNVPVKAYTANHDHAVHFHQLDKATGSRVRYQKVSEKSHKVLESDDIELGYEVRKGKYVTFDQAELDAMQPESTRTLEVSDFVDLHDIDPVYFERTYWLAPDGDAAARAYRLLLEVMEKEHRVGIGTVVMRNKQYLAAIRPLDGALAMSTMRFADEVVPKSEVPGIPSRRTKLDAKELKLAKQILDALAAEWEPSRYNDTYTDELHDVIKRKAKGETVHVTSEDREQSASVIDLMAALQASVDEAKAGRRRASRPAKKVPSAAAKKTTTNKASKQASRRATRKSA
jgi:DNA end-binding protein Ku